MIQGVKLKELRTHCDERGRLFEVLRSDDELFQGFGQAYITTLHPGVVKAWHLHEHQTDNISLISGALKLAIFDPRSDSPSKGEIDEFFLSDDNRLLLQIPAGVYHGFKNIGTVEAYVLNIPTRAYNRSEPDEHRVDPHHNDIPYSWSRKDG